MTEFEAEYQIACEAARQAGLLCQGIRSALLEAPGTMQKAEREPVTIADYASQAIILKYLSEHFPEDSAYAEEKAADFQAIASDYQREQVLAAVERSLGRPSSVGEIARWLEYGRGINADRVWTVDPIDGTKGFIRGDQFAVAIGLLVKGEAVVSVLACPLLPFDPADDTETTGIVASAERGQGALIEPLNGSTRRPMNVSSRPTAQARVIESVETSHTDHDFSAQILAAAGVLGGSVRMDSQAKYAAVADGRADIYIRTVKDPGRYERIWDHAGGVLLVQEAGGRVTDLDGRPIDFSRGDQLSANRGILATNGHSHEALLKALSSVAE